MKKNKFLLLLVISLLAIGGGFIDGYTYLIRDGSFATMQTGNLIFLTLHLLSNDISSIKRFLFPIISFVIGTIFIVIIRNYMKKKIDLFRLVSLGFVIIFIVASSFISIGEYNFISTSLLSFHLYYYRNFLNCQYLLYNILLSKVFYTKFHYYIWY